MTDKYFPVNYHKQILCDIDRLEFKGIVKTYSEEFNYLMNQVNTNIPDKQFWILSYTKRLPRWLNDALNVREPKTLEEAQQFLINYEASSKLSKSQVSGSVSTKPTINTITSKRNKYCSFK